MRHSRNSKAPECPRLRAIMISTPRTAKPTGTVAARAADTPHNNPVGNGKGAAVNNGSRFARGAPKDGKRPAEDKDPKVLTRVRGTGAPVCCCYIYVSCAATSRPVRFF